MTETHTRTKSLIRVCVGTEPKTEIPFQVLCHSIRRRVSDDVEVEFYKMDGPQWEIPKGLHQGTGFSLRRWQIPRFFDFTGKAIYLDADQLVLGDIEELWRMDETYPSDDACIWCTYRPDKHYKTPAMQSSVMLINCERAHYWQEDWMWNLLRTRKHKYAHFMHYSWGHEKAVEIPLVWNEFNKRTDGCKLLHYTVERSQPWYNPGHGERSTWVDELRDAIAAGAVKREDFEFALSRFKKPDAGDRRRTFGLHPYFKRFLPDFDKLGSGKDQ